MTAFVPARGDEAILEALFEFRYLRSGQLALLVGRSNQVVRRRLRALVKAGYVIALRRPSPTEQAAWALGPSGFEWIAHQIGVGIDSLPFSRKTSEDKVSSFFWRHHLVVADTWIAFKLALADHSELVLRRAVPEWEMKNARAKEHHKKFLLSEVFAEGGTKHVFRPDWCGLIYSQSVGVEASVAVCLEADRNTQDMRRIAGKFEGYLRYWRKERYRKVLGAVGMRVLFVLDDVVGCRRIRSMQKELACLASQNRGRDIAAFLKMFKFARAADVKSRNVIDDPIWLPADGTTPAPFFRPRVVQEVENAA